MLGHNAYITHLTSSLHAGIVSSPTTTRRVSAVQSDIMREKETISARLIIAWC